MRDGERDTEVGLDIKEIRGNKKMFQFKKNRKIPQKKKREN